MMDNSWNTDKQEQKIPKKVFVTRTIIAVLFAFVGFVILFSQLLPLGVSYLSGKIEEIKVAALAKPIPDSHKELIFGSFAYYNPGQSYFKNLAQKASELSQDQGYTYDPQTKQSKQIVVDREYSKNMALSIKKLGIEQVNITTNVESYDEDVYNLPLKKGLAHFKGTPIPGDGGNSFIYGHSAVPSFFSRNQNLAETIFSKLEKVDVGDEVSVFKEGKELKYIVRRKKIVEPSDFTVLQTQGDTETVTLMTCWPIGVPTKRLIVIAERYE